MRYFFFVNLRLHHRVFFQMIQEKKNNIKKNNNKVYLFSFGFFVCLFLKCRLNRHHHRHLRRYFVS